MIFVTIGTHNIGFNRLINKMDEIAAQTDEEIIVQIGSSKCVPTNAKWFRFCDYDKMLELINEARIVVSHGGAGTLIDVISLNKPLIIVPRLQKYREAIDDQQLELSKFVKDAGRAQFIINVDDLSELIIKNNFKILYQNKQNDALILYLKKYLTIKGF